jgi:hypothetical protein
MLIQGSHTPEPLYSSLQFIITCEEILYRILSLSVADLDDSDAA